MKRTHLLFLLAITVFVLGTIYSCKKDGFFTLGGKNGARGVSGCTNGIDVVCDDILRFNSEEHFDSVYACLNQEYLNYVSTFESTYSTVDDSTYEEICDSLDLLKSNL